MELINTNNGEKSIVTSKELTDFIDVQHSKAMKKVGKFAEDLALGS